MSKVDELKVYTGKETLQALLEGKTIQCVDPKIKYKIEDNTLYQEGFTGWSISDLQLMDFLSFDFTEVVTPQVGDWVRVNHSGCTDVGEIIRTTGSRVYAQWNNEGRTDYHDLEDKIIDSWEILSPEQVSEYKRELAFSKVGRKLNEFKSGDIVFVKYNTKIAIVVSNNNEEVVKLHGANEVGKGYTAKPHQLKPICFVENQVDLS